MKTIFEYVEYNPTTFSHHKSIIVTDEPKRCLAWLMSHYQTTLKPQGICMSIRRMEEYSVMDDPSDPAVKMRNLTPTMVVKNAEKTI